MLDRLDRRILRAVQIDAMSTAQRLGDLCGATASTAQRRLTRLRREKIIRSEVALIDGRAVGRELMMIVNVRLAREDGRAVRAFTDRILEHPMVMQFYFVTGTTDYVLILSARSMEEYDDFVQAELVADPHVVLSDTNVVIRPLKMTLAIPIDEPAPGQGRGA